MAKFSSQSFLAGHKWPKYGPVLEGNSAAYFLPTPKRRHFRGGIQQHVRYPLILLPMGQLLINALGAALNSCCRNTPARCSPLAPERPSRFHLSRIGRQVMQQHCEQTFLWIHNTDNHRHETISTEKLLALL